jgi:hypothetical protein
MNEWIIAPLLEPDPTGLVSQRPADREGAAGAPRDQDGADRRHGDRRDTPGDEADPDFGRGEDRRDDVV